MIDGAQKEKLKQIELISGMMKDNSTFETVMKSRINQLKPIIHFWSQGKTESSLSILKQA
jgi:katanin p80 WD40 repeat-containing subunit B1